MASQCVVSFFKKRFCQFAKIVHRIEESSSHQSSLDVVHESSCEERVVTVDQPVGEFLSALKILKSQFKLCALIKCRLHHFLGAGHLVLALFVAGNADPVAVVLLDFHFDAGKKCCHSVKRFLRHVDERVIVTLGTGDADSKENSR